MNPGQCECKTVKYSPFRLLKVRSSSCVFYALYCHHIFWTHCTHFFSLLWVETQYEDVYHPAIVTVWIKIPESSSWPGSGRVRTVVLGWYWLWDWDQCDENKQQLCGSWSCSRRHSFLELLLLLWWWSRRWSSWKSGNVIRKTQRLQWILLKEEEPQKFSLTLGTEAAGSPNCWRHRDQNICWYDAACSEHFLKQEQKQK